MDKIITVLKTPVLTHSILRFRGVVSETLNSCLGGEDSLHNKRAFTPDPIESDKKPPPETRPDGLDFRLALVDTKTQKATVPIPVLNVS